MSRTPLLWQKLVAWLGRGSLGQESSPISNESSPLALGQVIDPTKLADGAPGTLAAPEAHRAISARQMQITAEEELAIQQKIAERLRKLGLPSATFETIEQQGMFYAQHGIALQCFFELSCRALVWAAVAKDLRVLASQIICLPTDADNIIGQAAFTGSLHLPMEVVYLRDPVPTLHTLGQGVALWEDTVPREGREQSQWRLFLEYILRPAIASSKEPTDGAE